MTTAIQAELNIARNLILLAEERGLPSPFTEADVNEIVTDLEHNSCWKFNNLRRIKNALHEMLYASPGK